MILTLYKKQKIAIILVLLLFIALIIFLLYKNVYSPGFEDNKVQLYSYNNKSAIDYSIYLKQNNLYKGTYLEEGKMYITEFVDYIDANIIYEFNGERAADIKGEYNIIARVEGYNGEEDKIIKIWDKDFPIIQQNWFNTKDGKLVINEKVKLNLSEYNEFVKEIKETSKINCKTNLNLIMNINMKATTDNGIIEKNISPSLLIPLDVDMFEIIEKNILNQSEALEDTVQVQIPINMKIIIILGLVLTIILITLIILVFFIKVKPEIDILEKEVRKIFKKHSDRLVAINSEIIAKDSIYVKSIDDLVKVSDEIEKPILYKYSEDYKDIKIFYVVNSLNTFLFEINDISGIEPNSNYIDTEDEISSEDITLSNQLNDLNINNISS